MDQSLYVDPEELRGAAAELRTRAAETARMMAELKSDLAHEGECWGDDEPGRMFAESYVPESDRNLTGFENLVQNIEALSANLHALASNFENQDRDGGAGIRNSLPNPMNPPYPGPGYAPLFDQPNQGASPNREPSDGQQGRQPSVSPTAGGPVSDKTGTPDQQPSTRQPVAGAPADARGSGSGRGPGSGDSTGAGAQKPSARQQQTPSDLDTSGHRPSAPAAATPPPSASVPRSSAPSPTAPRASAPPAETSAPAAQRTGSPGPQPSAATAPRSSGAPWSKPGAGSQPGQQPGQPSPPRVSPPRRPTAPKPDPKPEQRKDAAPKPSPRPVTADEAMQIIHAMADRHNLRVTGFETSGLTVQTAREIAEAVDAVLTKYPLPLHGIAVAGAGDELSRVENRAEAAAPEPWIVLDRAAIADPGTLSGRDRARERPVEFEDRAVHSRMLRELGQVVDLVGGFRARTMAQRALITEYLRMTGTDGRTLAHVTEGYRRWRAQLGEYCFRNGVLDPGRALSAGFAGVEQGGVQAPGPAKVLHRLLLTMARLDMR